MNDTTRAPAAAIAAKDGPFFAGWLLDNITSSFLFSRPKKEKKKPFTCLSQNVASLLFC
jgi:hypothetical protein